MYYDVELDTKEDQLSIQSRCIPVSNIRAGAWVHHKQTRGSEGDYQVISVKSLGLGWISITVKAFSRSGECFEAGLLYRPGEKIEVLK